MENKERTERGKEKGEEKCTRKGPDTYLLGSFEISHIASDMMLLYVSTGVGPSARMRYWTYWLELRSRDGLAAPVTHSQRMKEK
jgi:hypothetical protein